MIRSATLKNFKAYNRELRTFLLDQTRRILKAKRGIVGEVPGEEEAEEAEALERLELEELRQKLELREKLWRNAKFFFKYFFIALIVSAILAWLFGYNSKDSRYSKLGKLGEKWKGRGWIQPEPTMFSHSKRLLEDLEKLHYMHERTSLSRFLHSQLTTHCIIDDSATLSPTNKDKKLCNEMYNDWRKMTVVKNKE